MLPLLIALVITAASAGEQHGIASFYSNPQATACGPRFDPDKLTAAHKTLRCGAVVKVVNKRNGRSVTVTISDHGPNNSRIIDLSRRAAGELDMIGHGLAPVVITW